MGKRGRNKFMGIFLAALSGLFFTLCSVTVKLLPRIDPAEVASKESHLKAMFPLSRSSSSEPSCK